MKKFVIYKTSTKSIVRLTNEEPNIEKMESDEDFDTVDKWMMVDSFKSAIEIFVSTQMKPKAKVIGQDRNVFNIMGICSTVLRNVNQIDKNDEMTNRVFSSGSYNEALSIMQEYCEFV